MRKNPVEDVFKAFLVENARYDGEFEIPCINTSDKLPNKLIPFSKAMHCSDYNQWVCFYESDDKFIQFWRNPKKYLPRLKKFKGIITPDFSLYRDMPYAVQITNTYRGKALGHWLQSNGLKVIPNVRWGQPRTYELACMGVEKNKTIAVGTLGCLKDTEECQWFTSGLDYVIEYLRPDNIIVYGSAPDKVFSVAKMQGINIIPFESETKKYFKEVKLNGYRQQ